MKENEVDEEKMIDLTNYFLYFNYYKGNNNNENKLNEIVENPKLVNLELEKMYGESLEIERSKFLNELKLSLILSNLFWVVWGVT